MTRRQRTPGRRNSRLGRGWETVLAGLHQRYLVEGRAFVSKTYPSCRVLQSQKGAQFLGVWDGEALPDYVGLAGGWAWFAEAKEADGSRWNYASLRGQQAEQLDQALRHGSGAVLLICDRRRGLGMCLPWGHVRAAWWAWELGCQRRPAGERAPNGTASIPYRDLERLAVHVRPALPGAFDYLTDLLAWRSQSVDWRRGMVAQLEGEGPRRARRRNQRGSG